MRDMFGASKQELRHAIRATRRQRLDTLRIANSAKKTGNVGSNCIGLADSTYAATQAAGVQPYELLESNESGEDLYEGVSLREMELGLVKSWQSACIYFGLPVGQVVPALFSPLPTEPPIAGIERSVKRAYYPVLLDTDRQTLREPAWGLGGEEYPLIVLDPRYPAQPSSQLDNEAIRAGALHDAQIVLLPALAVDADGVRLGQGGGWYDRALGDFAEGTPVLAAVFDDEVLPGGTIPLEPHDRLIDGVITPKRFIPLPVVGFESPGADYPVN